MIELQRAMNHKWIIDKNVNSKDILQEFTSIIKDSTTGFVFDEIIQSATVQGCYQGRNAGGSTITIGVRILQACYYMFGYTFNVNDNPNVKIFMPSPMTLNILSTQDKDVQAKNFLVNLFCLQFPHPYSWTPSCFELYFGRLIVKLLLDDRINRKLYIDECIWFLPFIEKLSSEIYEELISSILEYRTYSYERKKELFQQIDNYEYLFANVCHEMNYYFLRLFEDFGVFKLTEDPAHNSGRLFSFLHCSPSTYRNDACKSRKKVSGFVKLSDSVISAAQSLSEKFSPFDQPTTMANDEVPLKRDWLTRLYEIEPLQYLSTINCASQRQSEVTEIVNNMIYASKYGSRDGKEFEKALKPFMELFSETIDVQIISGAGNTDLLCSMNNEDNQLLYRVNIEAKTRNNALENVNHKRIEKHLAKHQSKFCIIIAPKFYSGVSGDIDGSQIVAIKSDDLGAYCYKECTSSRTGYASFSDLKKIIHANMGKDISLLVRKLTEQKHGLSVIS